jgi:glycosyltransferase involved in cell wall biosynthesis
MHIGLVSPAWPLDVAPNGIVTYVHVLRAELIRQGHRVSVFANVVSATNKDADIHLISETAISRTARRIKNILADQDDHLLSWGRVIADTISGVHRKNPIDVIEMEESFGWCADLQHRLPIPVVVKLHGPAFLSLVEEELESQAASIRIQSEGRALQQMRTITSPSTDTLQRTIARYGLNPPIGKMIPNPMFLHGNTNLWNVDRCDRKTLLFVGRFDKRKGGDIVLLAFRQLLRIDPDLNLIFVGPDVGLSSMTDSRMFFDDFADSLFTAGERQRINFLGVKSRREIDDVRTKAMLTIVASRWDNQPNTILEAMLQACPVVACDSGGAREIIAHEVTGLLAAANDINDICDKIMLAMRDPHESKLMGERARQFVLERHSAPKIANETISTYHRALLLARENPGISCA